MRAIGIDIGTTSICLGVYEEETGRLSAVRQEKNHFLEGTFRQDPDRIYAVVKEMLDNFLQSPVRSACLWLRCLARLRRENRPPRDGPFLPIIHGRRNQGMGPSERRLTRLICPV